MNSLQQITDAWGNWYSKQNGTSCRFTSSTQYSDHSELGNYHQYQVTYQAQAINYTGTTPPVAGSEIAYTLWYDNGTSVQQQQTFSETQTTSQAFTWSITEGISIGISVSATEGVPSVASSTQTVNVNLNLSATQSQTTTNTQSWTVNTPVAVPAMSSVEAQMIISTQTYDVSFVQTVLLQNCVAIWNNDKVNGHWLWFIPIQSVFQDCINNNIIDTTGYSIVSGGVTTQATGVFTGSQGINVGVKATQFPLRNAQAKLTATKPEPIALSKGESVGTLLAVAGD